MEIGRTKRTSDAYIAWLIEAYEFATGCSVDRTVAMAESARVLSIHAARMKEDEDFLSVAAISMAEILEHGDEFAEFTVMFRRAVDAARHRVVRAAKRWHSSVDPTQSDSRSRSSADEHQLILELIATLSVEDSLVVHLLLNGLTLDEIASELNVSVRTIYRRLESIRTQISLRGV